MRTPRSPPKPARRARRLAPLLCWAAALVPLVLVVPVFHGRRLALRSRSPPRQLAPVGVDKLPPGLLCLPTTAPRNLLVEIPFTASDVAALELTVGLWERTWPCYRPRSGRRGRTWYLGSTRTFRAAARGGARASRR